jgi:hypothetical protein
VLRACSCTRATIAALLTFVFNRNILIRALTYQDVWPVSDERTIYFHRVAAPANRFGIYRADSAGSALTPVLVDGFNNEFPSF